MDSSINKSGTEEDEVVGRKPSSTRRAEFLPTAQPSRGDGGS